MASGWYTWIARSNFFCSSLLIAFVVFSCHSKSPLAADLRALPRASKGANALLLCRRGNGFFSGFFRRYASQEQRFSHIGILSYENDSLYVYHTEASELTGIGKVRRESVQYFLEGIKDYAFYAFDYSDSVKCRILTVVKDYYDRQVPFDIDFDSQSDQALYCTELIAVAVNKATDSLSIQPTLLLGNKRLYSIDDICVHALKF